MQEIPADVPGLWEGTINHFREKRIAHPRVVIHGGYGKRNMGDDAILHVLLTRVRRHLPGARITVVCHGPERIAQWYPDVATCHFRSLGALKAILRSHLYFIGGGGIVNRINAYSGFTTLKIFDMKGKFLFLAAMLARLSGARTHYYAIGATSFPDPAVKWLARMALAYADVVSVRDPLTIRNLREIGVRRELVHILDPALSLEPAPREEAGKILRALGLTPKGARPRPLVGLNLRYVVDPKIDNDRSVEQAARLTEHLIRERGCDVLFLPISQHPSRHFEDDLDFGRAVRARLTGQDGFYLLESYHHPCVMMALLGEMDFLFLSRLHAVILSSMQNVPICVITYDDKVTEFAKMIGLEDRMLTLAGFNQGGISQKLEAAIFQQEHRSSPS